MAKTGPAFSEFHKINLEAKLFRYMLSRIPQKKYNLRSIVTALPSLFYLMRFQKALSQEIFDILLNKAS